MKKIIWTSLALLSTAICLAACGQKTDTTSTTESSQTAQLSDQETVKKDAEILLNAMLTKNQSGFARLYGDSYDTWTEEEVYPDQIQERVEKEGWTPEENYTAQYIDNGDALTPSQVIERFLKTRRDDYKDLGKYEIQDITVDGDQATVTFSSRHINGIAMGNAISNLYLIIFDNNLDVFAALNTADAADAEFKKAHSLTSFFLYYANFSNLLVGFDDVPLRLNETALTEGTYETTFDLEKNAEGHWVISVEDYKNLLSDMWNQSETADQVVYPGED